jgi:hypothetical protein
LLCLAFVSVSSRGDPARLYETLVKLLLNRGQVGNALAWV